MEVRAGSRNARGRILSVDPVLLFAVLGVFFPWVTGPGLSSSGIEQGGLPILLLAAAAYLLNRAGVRWAWIAAGVGAIASARHLIDVLERPIVSAGPGLWMSAIGLAAAAIWLLVEEVLRVREARGGSSPSMPAS